MQVDKIEMGTVVDHITAGKAAKVMKVLGIGENYPHRVAVMLNVPSKKMGTKDILKIEGKLVSRGEANVIALISPGASVNVIQKSEIKEKYGVEFPKELKFGKCPNPNCMSMEASAFFAMEKKGKYRCHYCERLFKAEELV